MKVGLILECGSQGPDEQVYRHLAHRLGLDIELACVPLVNKRRLVLECGRAVVDLLRDGCERVVIVWDLYPPWAQPGETHCRGRDREEILGTLHRTGVASSSVYLVCIEKELEAWLLSDARALRAVLSTRSRQARVSAQRRPEHIGNPKAALCRLFQQNGRGLYNGTVHAIKIVKAMPDLNHLRRCPSFVRFAEKLTGRQLK